MNWDYREAEKAEKEFLQDLEKLAGRAPLLAARDAQDQILKTSAFKGTRLRHSFVAKQDGQFQAVIATKMKFASFLETGTPPHIIRARRASFLRFMTAEGPVFRRLVNHPGTKATHFFTEAVTHAGKFFEDFLQSQSDELASKFSNP